MHRTSLALTQSHICVNLMNVSPSVSLSYVLVRAFNSLSAVGIRTLTKNSSKLTSTIANSKVTHHDTMAFILIHLKTGLDFCICNS